MNILELKNILKSRNLPIFNCNIKTSFLQDVNGVAERHVGFFEYELVEDFYFFEKKTESIYKLPKNRFYKQTFIDQREFETDRWSTSLDDAELIIGKDEIKGPPMKEDKPDYSKGIPISQSTTLTTTMIQENYATEDDEPIHVELEDVNMSNMTLRDYACIKLAVPRSEKEWLNSIIREKLAQP